MTTPFTPGIPTTGQSLGITKFPIQNNFTAIVEDMDTNHVAIGAVGRGKHKFMQMPEQVPAPATDANEGALYTKEASGQTALYFREESSGGEFGWLFRKGSLTIPATSLGPVPPPAAPTDTTIIDFSGYPNFFGFFNMRNNAAISSTNMMFEIYFFNSTLLFVGLNRMSTTSGSTNTFTASATFGSVTTYNFSVSGTILRVRQADLSFPATAVDWTLMAQIFPTT